MVYISLGFLQFPPMKWILSPRARISRENYEPIGRAGVYEPIAQLLVHPDPSGEEEIPNANPKPLTQTLNPNSRQHP